MTARRSTARIHQQKILLALSIYCMFSFTAFAQTTSDLPRPQYHFTPEKGWMNDPNGLVYQDGVYHLFYQYYPDSTVWGPMHWGHATSIDLMTWEYKPIALFPDSLGWIFSGSAVIDATNTAGFGRNAMVAIFTYHNDAIWKSGRKNTESQGLAYSTDNGETWTKYAGNPVLNNNGEQDFRDPKVFWNNSIRKWNMVLAVGDRIRIFSSPDLKSWQFESDFKPEETGPALGVWECPDLFPLTVKGTGEKKWVMIINHGDKTPNGGSGTRYFIGDFDGHKFREAQESKWLDVGTDFYAGVTYSNAPGNKRILLAWMSNWQYAQEVPTIEWRSTMTFPRELELIKDGFSYTITQKWASTIESRQTVMRTEAATNSAEIGGNIIPHHRLTFEIDDAEEAYCEVSNYLGEKFTITISGTTITVNRNESGNLDHYRSFVVEIAAALPGERVKKLDILFDESSAEILVNDGKLSLTTIYFPSIDFNTLKLGSDIEHAIKNITIYSITPTM